MISAITNRARSFVYGVTLPLRSLRHVWTHKKLLALSALPLAVTLFVYIKVIRTLQNVAHQTLHAYLESWGIEPGGWVAVALDVATTVALLVASALTFSVASTIVASPFNDFLAQGTEKTSSLDAPPAGGFKEQLRIIGIDIVKSLAASGLGILVLLLFWIPGVNVVSFLVSTLLVAFQFVSYPHTRRGIGFRLGLLDLVRYPFATFGFGIVTALLFSFPIVSSLSLPLAVVGGTLLFARSRRDDPFPLR